MMQLLAYGFCIVALAGICKLWVRRDKAAIDAATGKHELKRKFHRQGLLWKLLSALPTAILFALTFKGWCMLYAFAAFSFFGIAFWWYFFSRWLNVSRELSRWYFGKSNDLDLGLRDLAAKHDIKNQHLVNRVKVPLIGLGILLCMAVILSCSC